MLRAFLGVDGRVVGRVGRVVLDSDRTSPQVKGDRAEVKRR
jgi:hypothetical protein